MTGQPFEHLNEDQFADYVGGLPLSPSANAHLAACERCQQETQAFQTTMDDLSSMTLAWGRTRMPQRPAMSANIASLRPWNFGVPQLSMALAAVVLIVGGSVLWHVDRVAYSGAAPMAQSVTAENLPAPDSPTQIAQDNQLLQSVDVALGNNDPSPYQEYGLEAASRRISAPHQGVDRE